MWYWTPKEWLDFWTVTGITATAVGYQAYALTGIAVAWHGAAAVKSLKKQ